MKSNKRIYRLITWKDLRHLTTHQTIFNVVLPYPFLALSWWQVAQSNYIVGCVLSYFFFTAAFRQAHDGFHRTLGLGKKGTNSVLFISTFFLVASNHATNVMHLEHHRSPFSETDEETRYTQLPWYKALFFSLNFFIVSRCRGYSLATNAQKKLIRIDCLLIISFVIIMLVSQSKVLIFHFVIVLIGHSMVGFVAGWCVHHDCDDEVVARTERNSFINAITFGLLYHQEHHLFPSVPTNNLPQLAKRIDKTMPELTKKRII